MFYKASTSAQTSQKRAVILHKKEKVVSRQAHGSYESQTTSLRAICAHTQLWCHRCCFRLYSVVSSPLHRSMRKKESYKKMEKGRTFKSYLTK